MIDITQMRVPGTGDHGWLDLAVNSGKKTVRNLIRLEPYLRHSYHAYDTIINSHQIEPAKSRFEKQAKWLKLYFEKPPTDLDSVISTRRDNKELEQCPFCGRPCIPTILDHFIPKTKWPEYSLYPNNLVNQCSKCSSKKWEHYYCNVNNNAKFIHPLYSNLLSLVEYRYSISIPNPQNMKVANISFNVILPPGLTAIQTARLNLHIESLGICEYAIEFGYDWYLKKLRKASKRRVNICSMLQDHIDLESKVPNNMPDNDWLVCLYKEMLNNQTLTTHFNNLAP
ncbi:hypothetical protein [Vibrio atlanticus]|uniref:hypothetical protein n=1 Tax=Vibrio atlanticus TaxID=693153 RepID=UPI000EFADE57|nr:hypothetical protein [Vibrio atlanticus]